MYIVYHYEAKSEVKQMVKAEVVIVFSSKNNWDLNGHSKRAEKKTRIVYVKKHNLIMIRLQTNEQLS